MRIINTLNLEHCAVKYIASDLQSDLLSSRRLINRDPALQSAGSSLASDPPLLFRVKSDHIAPDTKRAL